jgi:hypothetical protein
VGQRVSITVVATSVNEVATGTAITVPVPAGTTTGHLMVAALGQKGSTAPADVVGWTKVLFANNTAVGVQVYTRWADTTEPASYVFTAGTTDNVTAEVVTLSGVDTRTPLDVAAVKDSAPSGTSFTFDTPLATVTDHALVLYAVVTQTTGNPLTADPALTVLVNSTGVGRRTSIAGRDATPAGTVPAPVYTTTSSLSKAAVALALRPASATTTPAPSTRVRVGSQWVAGASKIRVGSQWVDSATRIRIGGQWVGGAAAPVSASAAYPSTYTPAY